MPIYEYECQSCEHEFELIQKIDSEPVVECIICGEEAIRIIALSSFILKGKDWPGKEIKK